MSFKFYIFLWVRIIYHVRGQLCGIIIYLQTVMCFNIENVYKFVLNSLIVPTIYKIHVCCCCFFFFLRILISIAMRSTTVFQLCYWLPCYVWLFPIYFPIYFWYMHLMFCRMWYKLKIADVISELSLSSFTLVYRSTVLLTYTYSRTTYWSTCVPRCL